MNAWILYSAIIGLTSGIFLRSFFTISFQITLLILLLSFTAALLWRRKSVGASAPHLLCVSVFLLSCACGLLRMEIASWQSESSPFIPLEDTLVSLEGVVVREPDMRTNTQQLTVRVDDNLLLVSTDRYVSVSYGDVVSFTGKLEAPQAFQTDLGRSFNYEGYLLSKGVTHVVSFAKVEIKEQGGGMKVQSYLLHFKHMFMEQIELAITEPYAGLAEGLLLGVKQALGKDLEDAFRATGVIHIVVLSGYNIMLVVMFVMYVLSLFFPQRLRLAFGVVSIVLFACLVGLSATVVRASAMAALLLLATATGRTYAVLRALMLTGVGMLLVNPYLLVFDVGFQFSFIATLGLILLSPTIEKYLLYIPKFINLRQFLTATLATQVFITPLLLYHMGQFSVVSVLVNMLVLPMVPVSMLLTFLTGILGLVSAPLSLVIGFFAYLSLAYIVHIVTFFASLPFASIVVPSFPFYVVVLSYVALAYGMWRFISIVEIPSNGSSSLHTKWTIVEEGLFKAEVKELMQNKPSLPNTKMVSKPPIFFR